MATVTPNFGWDVPQSTDLVKDGATAIAALGNDIDTSLVDLKGGTTGQVLSKASNTDMDFTWSSVDPLTILDAKGDLISATAADSPARLPVGTNGQYLSANSATSTGLEWITPPTSGGMTLISTTTLSGASITLSSIPQTYKTLVMYIRNYQPATDGQLLRFRYNGDAGASRYGTNDLGVSTTGTYNGTSMYAQIEQDNTTATGFSHITIYDYTNTTTWKYANVFCVSNNSTTATNPQLGSYWAIYNQTGAISSITLFANSGNLTAGTVLLYGVS